MDSTLISFLPLAILLLIIWFVARRVSKKAGPETPGPNGEMPYGVRGWLALFVYSSASIAPLMAISRTISNISAAESKYPALLSHMGWGNYKGAVWVITISLIGWQIWVAMQLKDKLIPTSVSHVKRMLIIAPIASITLDSIAAFVFMNVKPSDDTFVRLISAFFVAGIWYIYFARSKRVANTYGTTKISLKSKGTSNDEPKRSSTRSVSERKSSEAKPTTESLEQKLTTLTRLLDRRLISQAEYEAKKSELLGKF